MAIFIGLSGWKQSGKDSAANYLIQEYGFKRLGFADYLKDKVAYDFNLKRSDLDNPETKETALLHMPVEVKDEFTNTVNSFMFLEFRGVKGQKAVTFRISSNGNMIGKDAQGEEFMMYHTPRSLCILEGSSKRCANVNYWVEAALKKADSNGMYVISDLRYRSELYAIKYHLANGDSLHTVRINRFDESPSKDPSERDLDDNTFDYVIENRSTLVEFNKQINQMMVDVSLGLNVRIP